MRCPSSQADAVKRLELRVARLERELSRAKRKAAADLAAERRRSQYNIARVLNRRRDRESADADECMMRDRRAGKSATCASCAPLFVFGDATAAAECPTQ